MEFTFHFPLFFLTSKDENDDDFDFNLAQMIDSVYSTFEYLAIER